MTSNKIAYGIDFGTTNSSVAILNDQNNLLKLPIDPLAEDPTVMRSVIYVNPDKEFYFGRQGIDKYLENINNSNGTEYKTVFTGRYINVLNSTGKYESIQEIADVESFPTGRLLQSLKSALANHTVQKVNLFGDIYPIEELIGKFLRELKYRSDKIIGMDVKSAVIGRPVEYVGDDNELAVKRMAFAAKYAGFEKISFEYEPIGAAYDYGVNIDTHQTALIFDFGGGTLDISEVEFPSHEILSNVGLKIGGDYFDSEIFANKLAKHFGQGTTYGKSKLEMPRHIYNSLETWYGISLLKTRTFLTEFESFRFMCSNIQAVKALESLVFNNLGFKMYDEIEKVKKNLSKNSEEVYKFTGPDIDIKTKITKNDFEKIIAVDIEEIENVIKNKRVDIVVTTGGSSLIPAIHELLVDCFGKEKIKSSSTFTSVAAGLARIAKHI